MAARSVGTQAIVRTHTLAWYNIKYVLRRTKIHLQPSAFDIQLKTACMDIMEGKLQTIYNPASLAVQILTILDNTHPR